MITADFTAARWRKSSYSSSSANCVEVAFAPAAWRKSSYSGNTTDCVEVAVTAPAVGVRDSKHPTAAPLTFTTRTWTTFLKSMRH